MANQFFIGQQIKIRLVFRNQAGQIINPTAVTAKVKNPDGTVTTPTASLVDGGYEASITPTMAGRYYVRGEGSGTPAVAVEGSFDVRVSNFS